VSLRTVYAAAPHICGFEETRKRRSTVTASLGKEEKVLAPVRGKIMKVCVKAGDKIKKDDLLLTFEAMKMEIEMFAPISGVVREVKVSSGASINTNDPLVIIARSG